MSAPCSTAMRRIVMCCQMASLLSPISILTAQASRVGAASAATVSSSRAPHVVHVAADKYTSAIRIARSFLAALRDATKVPALSVSVAVDDQIVWSEAVGYADLITEKRATNKTQFRIASLSKNITGTALGLLIEQGRLDPDAPVSRYVKNLPEAVQSLTTRQIASHQSGIAHYQNAADDADMTKYSSTTEALQKFVSRPLAHAPGAGETYSTYAYTLLAAVIEGASGQPYLNFMRDRIFAPLGMNSTVPDITGVARKERASAYETDSGRVVRAPEIELSGRWAGAGFLSTSDDLARLGMAHTNGKFLRETTVDMLNSGQRKNDGSLTKEGFGWGPRRDFLDRTVMWGNGRIEGATSALLVYRKPRVVVSILTNLLGATLDRSETQLVAAPFVAMAEGAGLSPLSAADTGRYSLAITTSRATMTGTLILHLKRDETLEGSFSIAGVKYGPIDLRWGWRDRSNIWLAGIDGGGAAFVMTGTSANGELELTAPRIAATLHGTRAP